MATSTIYELEYIKLAGERFRLLTSDRVDGVLLAMKKRPTWQGVLVSPRAKPGPSGEGKYPQLNLGWYPEHGYELQCLELTTPTSHLLATSNHFSKPSVYVE